MAETAIGKSRWQATQGIVGALNREWWHLAEGGSDGHSEAVRGWAQRHPELHQCYSLPTVLQTITGSDVALACLMSEVLSGSHLAGRVVLQSMVGRMVRMAQTDMRAGIDDYIAAMWCEIWTYSLERRPQRIAANLALDTLKSVHREHRWVVKGEVTTWPPGELLDELLSTHTGAARREDRVEGAEVLDLARQMDLIDEGSRAILTSVYLDGLTSSQAALRHHTSAGSIRVRCSRAVHHLASSAQALAAAA